MAEKILREEAADRFAAGELEEAARLYEAALAADTDDEVAGIELARVLIAQGRVDDAEELLDVVASTSLLSELARAEIEAARDRVDDAIEHAEHVASTAERQLRVALVASDDLARIAREAWNLRDSLLPATDDIVVAPVRRSTAALDCILVGRSLMAASPRIAAELALAPVCAMRVRAERLDRRERESCAGLLLRGTVALRSFKADEAKDCFEAARQEDGRSFAAHLGLGAAKLIAELALEDAIRALELPARVPDATTMAQLIGDYPALTSLERRVVLASTAPLASAIPTLIEAGAIMRVLPLDVRPTDRPELASLAAARHLEPRGFDALHGIASPTFAVAKVESLPDIVTELGWSFAHELAHLVWFHLMDEDIDEIGQLYARAVHPADGAVEHHLSCIEEFFAVSYADYLRARYGLPALRDDDATLASMIEWFERFDERSEAHCLSIPPRASIPPPPFE